MPKKLCRTRSALAGALLVLWPISEGSLAGVRLGDEDKGRKISQRRARQLPPCGQVSEIDALKPLVWKLSYDRSFYSASSAIFEGSFFLAFAVWSRCSRSGGRQ